VAQAVAIGSELGSYRLTKPIAEGGMAVVFLAEELAGGAEVALKVLRQELIATEDLRRRFLRESRYASSLDHPNIVRVYAAAETEDYLYIAMQYVPGGDLHQLLDREVKLDADVALPLLAQIAGGLDAAHEAGLLHRDVKPANVLLEGDGHCFLTDFGLSKDPLRDSRALTEEGAFVGTLEYTAPEEMLDREVDRRADVYSLACVLYETLTGEPPFSGRSDVELMQSHIQDPPPKIAKKRKDLPAGLNDVISKALAKDPEERFASCGELIEAAAEAVGVPVRIPSGRPPASLVLRLTGGIRAGSEIPVAGELLIGRKADGAGNLGGDPEISARHARIAREEGGAWLITDLGSSNGTFVNGRRLEPSAAIDVGDTLEIGGTTIVVGAGAPPAPGLVLRIELDPAAGTGALRVGDGESVPLSVENGTVRVVA